MPPLSPAIVERIDGARTVAQIAHDMGADGDGGARFRTQFRALYDVLNGLNELLLRYGADPS